MGRAFFRGEREEPAAVGLGQRDFGEAPARLHVPRRHEANDGVGPVEPFVEGALPLGTRRDAVLTCVVHEDLVAQGQALPDLVSQRVVA